MEYPLTDDFSSLERAPYSKTLAAVAAFCVVLCGAVLAYVFIDGDTLNGTLQGDAEVQVEGARSDELALSVPTPVQTPIAVTASLAKTVRVEPTIAPSLFSAATATPQPTATSVPSATPVPTSAPVPTAAPTAPANDDTLDGARLSATEPEPATEPAAEATEVPTTEPTVEPTVEPTIEPTVAPAPEPTAVPATPAPVIPAPTAVPLQAATQAPVPTQVPAPTAVPFTPVSYQAGTYFVTANDGLLVRDQPGGDSVGVLPGGSAVSATGQAAETVRLWVQISSPVSGWVAAEFLAVAPLPTPTPHAVATTSGGPTADQMAALANCESGGNYAINTGNGYYGAYQFAQQTWDAVAAQYYPHLVGIVPSSASAADQDAMMIALHSTQGFAPWPGCRASLGLP